MITVICGTNHPESKTSIIAQKYLELLSSKGVPAKYLSLETLPHDFAFAELYGSRSERFQQLLIEFIAAGSRFVIVSPEYNGSYPGVLKTFIDSIKPELWRGKKAALVGVADGRAGNLRGMDHLSDVLNHMGVAVLPHKVPVSKVNTLLNTQMELTDGQTIQVFNKQIASFLEF